MKLQQQGSGSGSSALLDLFAPPTDDHSDTISKQRPTAANGESEERPVPIDTENENNQRTDYPASTGSPVGGPLNSSPSRNFSGAISSNAETRKSSRAERAVASLPEDDSDDISHHRRDTMQSNNFSSDMLLRRTDRDRQATARRQNDGRRRLSDTNDDSESTPLLAEQDTSSLEHLYNAPLPTSFTHNEPPGSAKPTTAPSNNLDQSGASARHFLNTERLEPVKELVNGYQLLSSPHQAARTLRDTLLQFARDCTEPTMWIGACMFLLYQVVFCLTMGSAIQRPHAAASMLGLVTKMAALGIVFGAPVYWIRMPDIPALYPTVDLFSAPFLANIASIIDDALARDAALSILDATESDQVFLATFGFLSALSIALSGTLLVLTKVFRLANLGAFLPFPVLCGFFTAVGVLTWTLAFKVDTGGQSISYVIQSRDLNVVLNSVLHHAPSVLVAVLMKWLGPKHPVYVVLLVVVTIGTFYAYMFVFSVPLDIMVEKGWFWSPSELVYASIDSTNGFTMWAPPAPFGWLHALAMGRVHWAAVQDGLQTTLALSFLYVIRCTLHGAALKKNIPNLVRTERVDAETEGQTNGSQAGALRRDLSKRFGMRNLAHRRNFSEALDIESALHQATGDLDKDDNSLATNDRGQTKIVRAKPTSLNLKEILLDYGRSQLVCSAVGSFAITPCVAAAPAMFMVGAEKVAPQLGSVTLLFLFYLTDFRLVSYIPKPAFSSLLVLAFIDMVSTWFFKSYTKTKEKMEWLVVPLIVVFAFVVGLLSAVFLGIGVSTFLFVAAFFRSGVVKYVSNGMSTRSTIERPLKTAKWLDHNGDLMQILVLQNYLFFGNGNAIFNYVSSMFEEPPPGIDPTFAAPLPEVVIIDLTLVTGMDTSAVDIFADILNLCGRHNCKLFLSGLSTNLRQVMALGGVKPELTRNRADRKLRFFPNLDMAIGKAEDMLLEHEAFEVKPAGIDAGVRGFELALRNIDEQHDSNFTESLRELEQYTKLVEIEPSDRLYDDTTLERGLFFIESGTMKIERNSNFTLSRVGGANEAFEQIVYDSEKSISQIHARTGSIGREIARLKASGRANMEGHTFRVARIGPGWVLGSIEALSGLVHPGSTVAVTQCRLHYISYHKVQEIEQDNPRLVLSLHKLLSCLMAKRQSVTINQLATLHSIMTAPVHKKPYSRSAGAKLMNSINTITGL